MDGIIHKCPMCRHQPIEEWKDNDLYCPECGWQSENTKMLLEQTI